MGAPRDTLPCAGHVQMPDVFQRLAAREVNAQTLFAW
jgi:hypothetical protein